MWVMWENFTDTEHTNNQCLFFNYYYSQGYNKNLFKVL